MGGLLFEKPGRPRRCPMPPSRTWPRELVAWATFWSSGLSQKAARVPGELAPGWGAGAKGAPMSELLFEIGCEELPASYARGALDALPGIVARELSERGLAVTPAQVRVAGTPRRLAIGIAALPPETPRTRRLVKGPPLSAAFKDGAPSKAAEGFAQRNGLRVDQLTRLKDDKGEYIAAELAEGGRPTAQVLGEALPRVIEAIPFPKQMRWAALEFRFARPVRWLLAAYGGQVVPFSWGGCTAGLTSRGHRFLAPGTVEATTWAGYEAALEAAHVIVDPARRKALTRSAAEQAARAAGGTIETDEALLETVSFLVEEPHPVVGRFDPELLRLPREVIVTPMKHHQRYFPVVDPGQQLRPAFVTIANVPPRDPALVARGNERVLAARLADAKFFFDKDLETPLSQMAEGLTGLTFQEKLGTYAEKVERLRALAGALHAALAPPDTAAAVVDTAARLAKADLRSRMVYEFPELQGLMGRAYARAAGDPVAAAAEPIAEHYQPRFAGDTLPASHAGAIVSLADRLDTLAGIFGIGEKPTGSTDPYGLRRHALAVIAIVRAKAYTLSVPEWLTRAAQTLASKLKDPARAAGEATDYLRTRLENLLREEGLPHDAVEAALAARFTDINDAIARATAIAQLKPQPQFQTITIAFKRAANLLAAAPASDRGHALDPALFTHPAERALHSTVMTVAEKVTSHKKARRYPEALTETLALSAPIDAFFATNTGVLVMDKQDHLRHNRIALLTQISGLFQDIADFTLIHPS
jgi:glycyl-tRNA synthetase beta chain